MTGLKNGSRRWLLPLGLVAIASLSSAAFPSQASQASQPNDVPVPGDRPLRVAHAPAGRRQAIIYLHGMCGDEKGADAWADVATRHGTLITLRADVPCGDRPGFKWPKEPEAIQARLERALAIVRDLRGGELDDQAPILIGYSQGAHRAEKLAGAYPHRYRLLALGGPPTAASPDRLRHADRVAILGGELEDTSHMLEGYLDLSSSGIDTEFFTLPRAGHGGYGPEGRRVMTEVFSYLLAPRAHAARPSSRASGTSRRQITASMK